MRELDRDGDGSIDYREFAAFLRRGGSAGAGTSIGAKKSLDDAPIDKGASKSKPALSISDRVASELRDKFDAAIDSGKIKGYEEVFKAMDKDGNGRVSRREFEDGLKELRVHLRCEWLFRFYHSRNCCYYWYCGRCRCDWRSMIHVR